MTELKDITKAVKMNKYEPPTETTMDQWIENMEYTIAILQDLNCIHTASKVGFLLEEMYECWRVKTASELNKENEEKL